ncbi:MAG: siphovirus Gp157 family protein [Patescibacteria group bacterium]|nr:siphovirus Gp157 family protein [Patescibacteria group bacterium]
MTAALQIEPQDTEVMVKRPSFWALADDLQAYTETLAMVEAQLAQPLPDEERAQLETDRAEIQGTVERIAADLVTKADNLAGVLRRMKADNAFLKEEAARIAAKREAHERAEKWLKDYTAKTLAEHGWKNLKTQTNTISLRGNGGLKPLKLDEAQVPADYQTVDVRMPAALYDPAEFSFLYPGCKLIARQPDNGKIRAALDAGTEVPGARLEDRGQHIELR